MKLSLITGTQEPEGTDPPAGHLQMTSIVDNLDRYVIGRFATAAARDAAIPTPTVGMQCYMLDSKLTLVYTDKTSPASWQRPWNMAWGMCKAIQSIGSGIAFGSAWQNIVASTLTWPAGRLVHYITQWGYRCTTQGLYFSTNVDKDGAYLGPQTNDNGATLNWTWTGSTTLPFQSNGVAQNFTIRGIVPNGIIETSAPYYCWFVDMGPWL